MINQLINVDLKIWNKELKLWEDSDTDIEKGIYLIHFHAKNQIYEVRNLKKKPFKQHIIRKDEITLKPGKFIRGLENRIFGGSGYAKYWKNENEPQSEKREISVCFEKSTTIYLIADLSYCKENEYIELVEVYTKLILKRCGVEKQEKVNSEYYRYRKNISNLISDLNDLRDKVEKFKKNNS